MGGGEGMERSGDCSRVGSVASRQDAVSSAMPPRACLLTVLVTLLGPCLAVTINKCCPLSQMLHPSTGSCQPTPESYADLSWLPIIYSPAQKSLLSALPAEWEVRAPAQPNCRKALMTAHPDMPTFIVFDNGSLWLQESSSFVDPDSYCVDLYVAVACVGESDAAAPVRFKKCCGERAVYSEKTVACMSASENESEAVETVLLRSFGTQWKTGFVLTAGFPQCAAADARFVAAGTVNGAEGALKSDGSLLLKSEDQILTLRPGEFCLERLLEHSVVEVLTCPENLSATLRRPSHAEDDIRFSLYPAGLFLSSLFLVATLCAGTLLPITPHALHWRCQTSYVTCLLLGDLLLGITQLAGARLQGTACRAFATVMHFFFLAAFFWLNTMCINIWWTFRDLRPASMDKRQETLRFRLFQLYAWGGPLLISAIGLVVDHLPEEGNEGLVRPSFGHTRCWFKGDSEIFYYFFGPVGALLLVNVILFGLTARELTCGLWKREMVKSSTERATLGKVCLKLVVVMGLTWVIDVVSWAAGGPQYIWYVTDIVNTLQGVLIFAVVGCQPQVWAAINRMWCLGERRGRTAITNNHMSTYSQGLHSLNDSIIPPPSTKNGPIETVC